MTGPSYVRPLPVHASLENLKNQAKTLLKRSRDGDAEAIALTRAFLPRANRGLPENLALHDAQLVVARQHGFDSWPRLVAHLRPGPRVMRENGAAWIDGVPVLGWGRSCTTTYVGAVEAACAAMRLPFDTTTLLGDSALVFRVRWVRADDGSGWGGQAPLGECPAEMKALNASTGIVWREEWRAPTPEDAPRIAAAIDAGLPVLVYGLRYDVGMIHGHENGGLVVHLRDYDAKTDPTKVPLERINMLIGFAERIDPPLPRREAVLAGLRLAVHCWSCPPVKHEVFLSPDNRPPGHIWYGASAFAHWLDDLARYDAMDEAARHRLFFSTWWNASILRKTARVTPRITSGSMPRCSTGTRTRR